MFHAFKLVVKLMLVALFSSNPRRRHAARYHLLEVVVNKAGLRLYEDTLLWYSDAAFLQIWQQFSEADSRIHERHYVLFSLAKSVLNLPGDSVECGVFKGASSYLICLAAEQDNGHRDGFLHHVFDSFEGLSEPGAEDSVANDRARKWTQGNFAAPLAVVERNLERFGFIRYYKGWIPDRFRDVDDRSFVFVHIDVDLYHPTRDSLEFFYPRMVSGGIILSDDYGFIDCPGVKKAFDEFIAEKPERSVIHLPTGQGFIIKR